MDFFIGNQDRFFAPWPELEHRRIEGVEIRCIQNTGNLFLDRDGLSLLLDYWDPSGGQITLDAYKRRYEKWPGDFLCAKDGVDAMGGDIAMDLRALFGIAVSKNHISVGIIKGMTEAVAAVVKYSHTRSFDKHANIWSEYRERAERYATVLGIPFDVDEPKEIQTKSRSTGGASPPRPANLGG